jgi:hypothetical protein
MGLTPDVQNLVVLSFAAQADRTLTRHEAPIQGSLERIDDAVELREQPLPDEATWATVRTRSSALFGLVPGEVLKGTTLTKLADELRAKATERRPVLSALAQALKPHVDALGISTSVDRLVTLRSAQTPLSDLAGSSEPLVAVVSFAKAELATSEGAVSRCLGSASDVRDAVSAAAWDIINTAISLTDRRKDAAAELRVKLVNALQADEHVVSLKPELRDVQTRASRLLAESVPPPPPPPPPGGGPEFTPPPPPSGEEVLDERESSTMNAHEAADLLEALRARVSETPDARLTIQWRLTRRRNGGGA